MWPLVVIAVLAGLIALAVVVFCIPVDMTIKLERYGNLQTRVKLLWLFGLVHKDLRRGKKVSEEQKRRQQPSIAVMIEILKTRGFVRRVTRFMKEAFKSLRIKDLTAYFRIGLDDAADTGILFSIFSPAFSVCDFLRSYPVRLEPSFADEAVFEGYLNGTVRIWPIQLVPPMTRFVFSAPTMKAVKVFFAHRRRKRK